SSPASGANLSKARAADPWVSGSGLRLSSSSG
ncbi:MAG: hypothetical protein ACI9MR_005213, partial [Myxococcota bacterium]